MPQSTELEEDDNVGGRSPHLTSVVSEIMRMRADSGSTGAEGLIPGVIDEEVELAVANQLHLGSKKRDSANKTPLSESRSLQLKFSKKLCTPVLTGRPIRGDGSTSIEVYLVDCLTGHIVNSGPEASTRVEIVVLDPDFVVDNWTSEDFNSKIVRGREGKRLLTGDVYLNLEAGIGFLHNVSFTHTKCWMSKREFRLGARIVDPTGNKVMEAKTEPFTIEDRRGKLYGKHYPPSLSDHVWRLKSIMKDGAFHKRLGGEDINTVKDLWTLLNTNPQRLHHILTGMSAKMWEDLVDHLSTCRLDQRLNLYWYPGSQQKNGVVFSVVGQLLGVFVEGRYTSMDKLSKTQKDCALNLVISALRHREEVITFDDEASLFDSLSRLSISEHPLNFHMIEGSNGCMISTSNQIGTHDDLQPAASAQDATPFVCSAPDTNRSHDFSFPRTENVVPMCDQPLDIPSPISNYIGTYDDFQPVAPSQEAMPSNCSAQYTIGFNDFSFWDMDNVDPIYDQSLDFPSPVTYSMICDAKSMIQAFNQDDHLKFSVDSCPIQHQSADLESMPGEQNDVDGAPLAHSTDVVMSKAQRKYLSKSKRAQIRWRILSSVMKFVSVRQDVAKREQQENLAASSRHICAKEGIGCSLQSQNPWESKVDQDGQTAVNDILRARSAAFAMNKGQRKYLSKRDKARSRWRVLSSVMTLCSVTKNPLPQNLSASSGDVLLSISSLVDSDSLDGGYSPGCGHMGSSSE